MYNMFGEAPVPISSMPSITYPSIPLPNNTIVTSAVLEKEIDRVEVYGISGLSLTLRDVLSVIYGKDDQYIAVHFKNGDRKIFLSNNILYIDIQCKQEVKQNVSEDKSEVDRALDESPEEQKHNKSDEAATTYKVLKSKCNHKSADGSEDTLFVHPRTGKVRCSICGAEFTPFDMRPDKVKETCNNMSDLLQTMKMFPFKHKSDYEEVTDVLDSIDHIADVVVSDCLNNSLKIDIDDM